MGSLFLPRPPLWERSDLLRTWTLGTLHWENLLTVVTRAAGRFLNSRPEQALPQNKPFGGKAYLPTLSHVLTPLPISGPRGSKGPEVGRFTDRQHQSASRFPGTGMQSARPGAGKGAAAAGQPWRAAPEILSLSALSLGAAWLWFSRWSCAPRCLYMQPGAAPRWAAGRGSAHSGNRAGRGAARAEAPLCQGSWGPGENLQ